MFGVEEVLARPLRKRAEASTISTLPGSVWRFALAQDQDAGGQAGAVEEVGRQADDGLDQIHLQQLAPDLALDAAAEERALGQHHGHAAGAPGPST